MEITLKNRTITQIAKNSKETGFDALIEDIKNFNHRQKIDKKVFNLACALGCPENLIHPGKKLVWNIAPNDDALSAEIILFSKGLEASIWLNYLNKPTKVIGISINGNEEAISGVLKKTMLSGDHHTEIELIRNATKTFRSHLNSMLSGPFSNNLKIAA